SSPRVRSRAPTATITHGSSPAPTITCFVSGGQWTKSHACRPRKTQSSAYPTTPTGHHHVRGLVNHRGKEPGLAIPTIATPATTMKPITRAKFPTWRDIAKTFSARGTFANTRPGQVLSYGWLAAVTNSVLASVYASRSSRNRIASCRFRSAYADAS